MENHFGQAVAARYDERTTWRPPRSSMRSSTSSSRWPATVQRSSSGSVQGGSPCRWARGASRFAASTSPRRWSRRLRAKPGGDAIGVTIGDFATARVEGTYTLVYLVFNTIMNLTTQDEQVACFENAAAHLGPGGRFVIEVDRAGLAAAASRRDVPGVRREPETLGLRRESTSSTQGFGLAPLLDRRTVECERLLDRRFVTCGRPSSTSWHGSLGCRCASAGAAGVASRSRAESTKHVSVWEKH